MALPTLQDAKDYLRVDLETEDALLTALLARARATVETYLGYPLIAVPYTYVSYSRRIADTEIQLPGPFLATGPTPVFTDVNGVTVDASTYILDGRAGRIRAIYGGLFAASPYTVVATIGLSAHPDYATRLEALASTSILDLVSHWYENRNPMIGDDIGQGVNSTTPAIPQRILSDIMMLPGGWAVA